MRRIDARPAARVVVAIPVALASVLVLGGDRAAGAERGAERAAERVAGARAVRSVASQEERGRQTRADQVDLAAALSVLRSWDERRARAWATDDARALGRLYTSKSVAGAHDLRLLRDYRARELVVRRLVTQVFAVRLLGRDKDMLRLSVFDRVAGGEVVRGARVRPLASSPPVRRTVVFRRTPHRWVVESVSDSVRAPPGARR